jgi:ribosomal protein S18 acetylase RimI-like enzyme
MIKLVPLTQNDLEFLLEIRNDESTRYFLENNSVFSIEECKNWFSTYNPKWFLIKNDDQPVGYFRTNGDEIGCDIHPKFRRLGFARMAYLEYLKNKNFATLWVFEDNFAKNLYSELGFQSNGETKLIRDRIYLKMIYSKKSI